MRYISVALCAVLAGCASTNPETVLTGERYDVEFSVSQTPTTLEMECAPPSIRSAREWVDECNAIARKYLGTLVASGRIADFPEPPFGQAGQSIKGIWSDIAKNDGAISGSQAKISGFTLGREMEWAELR